MANINARFFQWLCGERKGEIVLFDSIVQEDGMMFITFKDNSRINEEFVMNLNETEVGNRLMAEIENPSKCWNFKQLEDPDSKPRIEQDWESQTTFEVPTADEIAHADLTGETGVVRPIPKRKRIQLIPPPKTRQEVVASRFGTIIQAPAPPIPQPEILLQPQITTKHINTSDPVYIMMDKSKKRDTEVNMTLTISLPAQSLFDVVKDSFEDGDKKALEYIIENIDISDIKTALKEGIRQMYNPGGVDVIETNVVIATELYQPECIEEPIISDPKPQEIVDQIEGLKEEK